MKYTSSLNVRKEEITNKIIESSLHRFNKSFEDVLVKKDRENTYARQVIMAILSDETKLKLREIGDMFNRHHSTVIHARETIKDLSDVYPEVIEDINAIRQAV